LCPVVTAPPIKTRKCSPVARGRAVINHQTVMECGRVLPTHLVGHLALELEEGRY
jgi:hypothetical protein